MVAEINRAAIDKAQNDRAKRRSTLSADERKVEALEGIEDQLAEIRGLLAPLAAKALIEINKQKSGGQRGR